MASETLISQESHVERGQSPPVCPKSTGECGLRLPQVGVGVAELKLKPMGLNCGWGDREFPKAVCPVPSHWSMMEFLLAASKAVALGGPGGVTSESA